MAPADRFWKGFISVLCKKISVSSPEGRGHKFCLFEVAVGEVSWLFQVSVKEATSSETNPVQTTVL